jgi:hypothetical protein
LKRHRNGNTTITLNRWSERYGVWLPHINLSRKKLHLIRTDIYFPTMSNRVYKKILVRREPFIEASLGFKKLIHLFQRAGYEIFL